MRARILGVALAVLLAAGVGAAWAEEIDWDLNYSGSYVDTPIDLNGDGTTANAYTLGTKGTGGTGTITGVFETVIVGPTPTCPAPLMEFRLLYSVYVQRFPNGDLLFARQGPGGSGCVDPVTGTSRTSTQYLVVGGTGKYQGASGIIQDDATFIFLLQSPIPSDPNPLPFAALLGRHTGTVITVDD